MGFVLPLSYLTWLPEAAWVGKPQTTFGPQHCLLCLVSQAECDGRKLLPEEATHLWDPCSFQFIFLYQHREFLSTLTNSSLGLQGWEDTVYKSSYNFRSLSQSSLSIHLIVARPTAGNAGFRSFSKMTLLCLQSGFFIEISLEVSNMFALWRRELGWPLTGQLRPWRYGSLFLPFLSLHGMGREHSGSVLAHHN